MSKFVTEVYCSIQVEGTHNWPGCPFDEVAYLRDLHRHIFFIKAYKVVDHADRDCEFIMLKHKITNYLEQKYGAVARFGAMSCEMIGSELLTVFGLSKVDVSEDNENGSVVTAC